jgi:hypothetical protein
MLRPNPVAQANGTSRRRFSTRETTSYYRTWIATRGLATVAAALRRRTLAPVRQGTVSISSVLEKIHTNNVTII